MTDKQKILAISTDEKRYLLDAGIADGLPQARLLDLERGLLYAPIALDSILAHSEGGEWEEYSGSQDILPGLLKQVKEQQKAKRRE